MCSRALRCSYYGFLHARSTCLRQPGTFNRDMVMRTGVELQHVEFSENEIDQFSSECVSRFDAAIKAAQERGTQIKGLVICNPHNPLGQCYTKEALLGLLQLCSRWNIHLISDEIYALSVYERHDRPSEAFNSVLSLDLESYIRPELVHVLYGMSKNFSAGGMRLGCLHSRNKSVVKAVRATCRFFSPSQFSMNLAARFLEDHHYMASFLRSSNQRLLAARLLAEKLLEENEIQYHPHGNAGFFIWLDLSPYLDSDDDGWKAHDRLLKRLENAGVRMSSGKLYRSPMPGHYRLLYSIPEETLREGTRRLSCVVRQKYGAGSVGQ